LSDRANVVVITEEAHRMQHDIIDRLARTLPTMPMGSASPRA
jgi:hypothetical protein